MTKSSSIPKTHRMVVLRRRPDGAIVDGDTELVEVSAPEVADGQALVRTLLLAMDPVTRVIINHDIGLVPPINVGEPLRSFGAGEIIVSRNRDLPVGKKVSGFFEWAELQIVEPGLRTNVLDEETSLDEGLNLLGHTAMAAFFGLSEIGKPAAGDTVVVTGAAGAVGCVAGQLARIAGCRVVGIASGPEKGRWLVEELGFEGFIDHRHEDVGERLSELCPDGVDLVFDNVGGTLLDQLLLHVKKGGRVVCCGASSAYTSATAPLPLTNGGELDVKGVSMSGFNAMDHTARFDEAASLMREHVRAGRLRFPQTVLSGLESAPEALNMLFDGRSRGRLLLKVDDACNVSSS